MADLVHEYWTIVPNRSPKIAGIIEATHTNCALPGHVAELEAS